MTVAITGSMAFDHIMTFSDSFTNYILPDQLERLSVSFLVDSMRKERGGVAGNIAYTMSLLGESPLLMAAVGPDAADYIADLAKRGVDTSAVLYLDDVLTASFFVSTDQQNRQIANFFIGAMGRSGEISFYNYRDHNIDLAVISPNLPEAMVQYAQECVDLHIPYLYDPSQQIPLLSADDLIEGVEGAHILMLNDYELEMLKERTGLCQDDILGMSDVLIVTRAQEGSSIYAEGEEYHIPAIPTERVADPTGAGDAYRGGLLTALQRGLGWLEAGQVGALTALYALEEVGTQRHSYTRQEFLQRYFEHFERTPEMERFFEG